MPTYVYVCGKCRHRFELFHSITDESVKRCPRCRGRAARVPAGGAGILFKGSGFYITDYRSASYQDRARQETAGGGTAPAGGGTAPAGGGTSPAGGGASPAGGGAAPAGGGPARPPSRGSARPSRRGGKPASRPSGDA